MIFASLLILLEFVPCVETGTGRSRRQWAPGFLHFWPLLTLQV